MTQFEPEVLDARRARIEQLFVDQNWAGLADLDEWDGADLMALRCILTEEQFDTLLDVLGEELDAAGD